MDDNAYTFSSVPYVEPPSPLITNQVLTSTKQFSTGKGSNAAKIDRQGLWLGANKFVDAPFSVDMAGNLLSNKLTIKNDNGKTVIDSGGIVSSTNFPKLQIFNTAISPAQTTTSTSYIDITGGSLGTMTVSGSDAIALFYCMGQGFNSNFITSNGSDRMVVSLYDSVVGTVINCNISGNGTTYTPDGSSFTFTVNSEMVTFSAILTIAVGTHDYKMQMKAVNGGTANLTGFLGGIVVLGGTSSV